MTSLVLKLQTQRQRHEVLLWLLLSNLMLFMDLGNLLVDGFITSPPLVQRRIPSFLGNKCTGQVTNSQRLSSFGGDIGQDDQAVEALQSLVDFHEGRWSGTSRSFSVVADTAAGIVQRKQSPEYEVSVKVGLSEARDYSMTETFSWSNNNSSKDLLSSRSVSLTKCNVDVDSVDASYSFDSSLPDFPADISGTDHLCRFAIEHCIAASDDKRMRCLVLYGMDQSLQRIVVCEERRIAPSQSNVVSEESTGKNQLTAMDLLEMQDDVDRLVEKLTGNMDSSSKITPNSGKGVPTDIEISSKSSESSSGSSIMNQLSQSMSSTEGSQEITPHDMSMLEVSSGVWLGDAIIRDHPSITDSSSPRGKGFGSSSQIGAPITGPKAFASWAVGVQKVAWRWMWNFGDEIREVVDVGKAMGAQLADCMSKSVSGSVCVNESLSRRVPKEERMVYLDWSASDRVGFLLGPVMVQVPRYLSFDGNQKASLAKPFFTDFLLFQGTNLDSIGDSTPDMTRLEANENADDTYSSAPALPDLCCSRISRIYNSDGHLKQGCTSFYTFKRFGVDEE